MTFVRRDPLSRIASRQLRTHRADDLLEGDPVADHALLDGGRMPRAVPAGGLCNIGGRIGTWNLLEVVWIVRSGEGPGDMRRAIRRHGEQLLARGLRAASAH